MLEKTAARMQQWAHQLNPTPQIFDISNMATVCKHPKVRVVSRHEDTEFVECLDCGEIFDSEEFRDMAIEEDEVEEESDS